jgi:hypothetical protein
VNESSKITAAHLSRAAVIYVRQSTLAQVERNTESTARQYDLVIRARQLGWPAGQVRVVDGDLGISGSVTGQRDGFEELVAEVALGQVGIVLALEVSRLARDNAVWYRLLDLAGICDTLVCDGDGVYHPALFNDRLLLGMKGIIWTRVDRRYETLRIGMQDLFHDLGITRHSSRIDNLLSIGEIQAPSAAAGREQGTRTSLLPGFRRPPGRRSCFRRPVERGGAGRGRSRRPRLPGRPRPRRPTRPQ